MVGLHFDIQSFIIRFDLAPPIQIPYFPEGTDAIFLRVGAIF